jgi:hypothetical protein
MLGAPLPPFPLGFPKFAMPSQRRQRSMLGPLYTRAHLSLFDLVQLSRRRCLPPATAMIRGQRTSDPCLSDTLTSSLGDLFHYEPSHR